MFGLLILLLTVHSSKPMENEIEAASNVALYLAQEKNSSQMRVNMSRATAIDDALKKIKKQFAQDLEDFDYHVSEMEYQLLLYKKTKINLEEIEETNDLIDAKCISTRPDNITIQLNRLTNLNYAIGKYNEINGIKVSRQLIFSIADPRTKIHFKQLAENNWQFTFSSSGTSGNEKYLVSYDPLKKRVFKFINYEYSESAEVNGQPSEKNNSFSWCTII